MKYDHAVIYNGRYYAAGVEIPEEKVGAETKAPTSPVAEAEEKPIAKKTEEKPSEPMTKRKGRPKKDEA